MKLQNKDFISRMINIKTGIDILIGLNGTGKTYLLNEIKNKYDGDSLLINGDGLSKENQNRKIAIEVNRGNNSNKVNNTINKIDLEEYKIHGVRLSSGQLKINNIIECLENYAKNKHTILLDEPDVNLDTKLIVQLVELLNNIKNKYDKHIIIVTHNPHLLEILNIDIDNIYIKLDKYNIANTTKARIYNGYVDIMSNQNVVDTLRNIESTGNNKKINIVNRALMRYNGTNFELLNISINSLTHYTRFYESLFFKYVILFEGQTESEIVKYYMKNRNFINHNIMFSKERALLYMYIYNELFIEVTLVLDRDSTKGDSKDKTNDWNNLIDNVYNKMFKKHIKFMENNIENELGIKDTCKEASKDTRIAYIIEKDTAVKNKIIQLIENISKDIRY